MRDRKMLVTVDKARGTLTVRRTLEGRLQDVLHIAAETLWGLSGGVESVQTDKPEAAPAGFGWLLSA